MIKAADGCRQSVEPRYDDADDHDEDGDGDSVAVSANSSAAF